MALSVAGNAALDRAILNAHPDASDFGDRDFTVMVRFVLLSVRESYVAFGRWFSGGTATQCMWYIGGAFNSTTCNMGVAAGTGARGVEITGLTWAVGNEYTIIGRRAGTSLWVDRINHTTGLRSSSAPYSDAAITTLNSVSARNLKLGEFDAGAAYNMDLDASVAAILPYKASDAQVRELYANPWQLAATDLRRIYFAPSGGGTTTDATIAGTQAEDVGAITAEATTGAAIAGAQASDIGAITTETPANADIAGVQASDIGAITAEATTGSAIAGTQASDGAAVEVTASTGQTDAAVSGIQTPDVGAIDVTATLRLEIAGAQATDLGYIVVEATLPATMAGTQASDGAAITIAGSSIWTDINPASSIWTDIDPNTIWTGL